MDSIPIDRNSFDVLFDCISDDLNFLYFIKINNIKIRDKEVDFSNRDWRNISHRNLSIEFIRCFR